MIRQDARPIEYGMTRRPDNCSTRTSGNAGVVIPVAVAPLFRKDSCSGRIALDLQLAEMPKPLENAVVGRGQVWFVPRPSFPQFSGLDEYTHSYHGKAITQMNGSNRTPPSLYKTITQSNVSGSPITTSLGLHLEAGSSVNRDYFDAYYHIQNFRLAAHSSKLTRYPYIGETGWNLQLVPAFWPRNRMHEIVPDYEQALVVGSLDLDVTAGQIPVSGFGIRNESTSTSYSNVATTADAGHVTFTGWVSDGPATPVGAGEAHTVVKEGAAGVPDINAEMTGVTIPTSLMDIDKARTTQAFAKRAAAYAGADFSGYNNDDVVMSELLQGFTVPNELMHRPWLLDSKTVVFGMTERHATDAANLDDSVSTGRAQMTLSVNVPTAEYGGIIMATVEVMPERLYERQADEYLYVTDVDDLPNALRDIQRTEPVDTVLNRRLDTAHSTPAGTFGYEPMNSKWKREFTRLGGEFIQSTPGIPNTSGRTAIWQADIVDPVFTSDHWLCPSPFPQDVFSVPANHIVNIGVQQQLTITGITQFGDVLNEDNSEFAMVEAEQV